MSAPPALSRRTVLGGAAALGLSAAAGIAPRTSLAQAPAVSPGKPHRIDVHHHIAPPKYVAEFKSELQPPVIAWSVSKSLDDMDKSGVGRRDRDHVDDHAWQRVHRQGWPPCHPRVQRIRRAAGAGSSWPLRHV